MVRPDRTLGGRPMKRITTRMCAVLPGRIVMSESPTKVQLDVFVQQAFAEPDIQAFAHSTVREHANDPSAFPLHRTIADWYAELNAFRKFCDLCEYLVDANPDVLTDQDRRVMLSKRTEHDRWP